MIGNRLHKIRNKLVCNNAKNDNNTHNLHEISLMVVEHNTQSNGEDLPGGDDEGYEVLLELFDHPVDEHLTGQG